MAIRLFEQKWDDFLKKAQNSEEFHPHRNKEQFLHRDIYKKSDKQVLFKPELFHVGKNPIGKVGRFEIRLVHGNRVRHLIDSDWTDAGNPARDIFLPDHQVWIEYHTSFIDVPCFIVHEITEFYHMLKDGLSYDKAHDKANKYESKLRDSYKQWEYENSIEIATNFIEKELPEALKI